MKISVERHERKTARQIDGHYCYDWDQLAVSAWTPEYEACQCFPKTWLGKLVNRFAMWNFNRKDPYK